MSGEHIKACGTHCTQPSIRSSIHRYGHLSIGTIIHPSTCEWRMRCKSFIGCIRELPDRSSKGVELRIIGALRILNREFILTGLWLVGPIGGGIHPDGSKCPKDFLR